MTTRKKRRTRRRRTNNFNQAMRTVNYGTKAIVGVTALGIVANTASNIAKK